MVCRFMMVFNNCVDTFGVRASNSKAALASFQVSGLLTCCKMACLTGLILLMDKILHYPL